MTSPVIDMHVHSNNSDGRESVAEVFAAAAAAGVTTLALTDHDTTAGWAEARELARQHRIGFVPGIEVTTRARVVDADGEVRRFGVHMLAYLPNPNNVALAEALRVSVESREVRLREITERIAADYHLSWSDVLGQLTDGATPGRPAVADALIANGHFEQRGEVFDKLFFKGSPYYVPNTGVPETIDAIRLIRAAGGVPVIAHPLSRGKRPESPSDFPRQHFLDMIESGLAGFEAHHRDVEPDVAQWLVALAKEFDLVITGSSDYHGADGKPNLLGEHTTTPEMLKRILDQGQGSVPELVG